MLKSAVQLQSAMPYPPTGRVKVGEGDRTGASQSSLPPTQKHWEAALSEAKHCCAELEITNRKLVKANEDLTHFAYIASHDLQEPLRAMALRSQRFAAHSAGKSDPETEQFVSHILNETARMRATIVALMAYSQGQRSELVQAPVELKTVVEIALSNLAAAISETAALLTYEELPRVNADAAQLVQVFQNLIGNALKYRNPGRKIEVHISAERTEPGDCLVAVEDNGMGFEERYAEQIFEVFKRLHGRDVSGAGIGLATCKRIVESHGGRIWAKSAVGVGSQFCFSIPAASC